MTPAKRSRAEADEDNEYESPDERDFSRLRAGSSNSGRSTNEAIRQVQTAPMATGTMARAGKITEKRPMLTVLGKDPVQ
jgi:hypothetical protein